MPYTNKMKLLGVLSMLFVASLAREVPAKNHEMEDIVPTDGGDSPLAAHSFGVAAPHGDFPTFVGAKEGFDNTKPLRKKPNTPKEILSLFYLGIYPALINNLI